MNIPNPGAVIRVTTRYRNIYLYDTSEYRHNTYEGTVVSNEKFDQPATFCMTGDERMPIRNIDMSNVVKLELLTGSARKVAAKSGVRVFRVKSDKNVYTVTMQASRFQCTCVGFQYRRHCRHTKAVAAKVGM
jgi:hypothetical protein